MLTYTYNPSFREVNRRITASFRASLFYIVSSIPAKTTQWDYVSQTGKKNHKIIAACTAKVGLWFCSREYWKKPAITGWLRSTSVAINEVDMWVFHMISWEYLFTFVVFLCQTCTSPRSDHENKTACKLWQKDILLNTWWVESIDRRRQILMITFKRTSSVT